MTVEHVVVRETQAGRLEVQVGPPPEAASDDIRLSTGVRVSAASPVRARDLAASIADAMRAAEPLAPPAKTVRVRTRKKAAALDPADVADAVVVVLVTERNARHVPAIVDAVRAARPLAVQLAWDGTRDRDRVFAVLEQARSTPRLAAVYLARTSEPCFFARARAHAESERRAAEREAKEAASC